VTQGYRGKLLKNAGGVGEMGKKRAIRGINLINE
jgi:hypothetical protein